MRVRLALLLAAALLLPATAFAGCAEAVDALRQQWETLAPGPMRDAVALDILHAEHELKEKDERECRQYAEHAAALLKPPGEAR